MVLIHGKQRSQKGQSRSIIQQWVPTAIGGMLTGEGSQLLLDHARDQMLDRLHPSRHVGPPNSSP